jgi:CHASE2 domain-containing sensor protein
MTKRRRPLARYFSAAIVILGVSAATAALEHIGLFDHFETAGLDSFNLLQNVRNPREVVMIGITDVDYASDLFHATSPLDCAAVRRIIAAIASGQPRIIAVDIDTSTWSAECRTPLSEIGPPIVWAQDAIWHEDARAFTLIPVLGGAPLLPKDRAGVVQFPQDSDGVIRSYVRTVPVVGGHEAESFPWVVVSEKSSPRDNGGAEELRLNFAGERFKFEPLSVTNLLAIAEAKDATGWKTNGPLKDRIALLGGNYRAARDAYVTPVGPMQGVQILAQAIESEAHHGGIRPVNEWLALLLEILSGVLLVVVHQRLHRRPGVAVLVSLVLMPVLALVSSLLAFSTLALWFNFVPVVVSVLIHQLWERIAAPA